MTHDELVEKVARAIYHRIVCEDGHPTYGCACNDSYHDEQLGHIMPWRKRVDDAEAAIAAMREVLESDLTLKAAMNLELIGCWCQGPQSDQFHNFCDYHQGFESGVDLIVKAAGMVAE